MTFAALTRQYPALLSAPFRRYWFASFASVGATQLITLGQGWLIYQLSSSALQLGYLGAAVALPNLLMTLPGGVIADRINKRLIMLATSAATAALLVVLAILDYSGQVEVWHVLVISAAISTVTGLDWPARVAIFPQLVEKPAFISAVALNSFIWQVTRMAMPALGGALLAISDTWVIFALGAIGFAIMFVAMLGLQVNDIAQRSESPWEQIKQGVSFIARTDLFRWLILLTFIGMLLSNSYIQLMPLLAATLGAGEVGFGALLSAGGIGSIAGTLMIGAMSTVARPGRLMLISAVASAGSLMGFALILNLQWFGVGLALVFVTAALASTFMVASMTVLQMQVPNELRGRVMGIHAMGYSLMPLGGLLLGYLATLLDPTWALVISNGLFIVAIFAFGFAQPSITDLDPKVFSGDD